MIIVAFTKDFKKSLKKRDNFIQKKVSERIRIFRQDPFNILLNNHKPHGEYEGYSSIDITGDFRAIFKYLTGNQVVFYYIGTHPELYE